MARKLVVEVVGDTSNLERSFGRASRSANHFDRSLSHSVRGVAAGSGAFKSLGRSIAFASGGFIAFAGLTDLLKQSIDAGTEAAATQKQLAAQFKASGQNLGDYQKAIDDTSLALSQLSGFQDDQLKRSFTTAFRSSQDVAAAFKIQAVAADAARGTGKDLETVTLGLTKAYLGQTAAAKRLGIIIPTNVKGMAALEFVGRRFAGQAQAGTTAQERFAAALHNTEQTIGLALLPTLTKYLDKATKWLDNSDNQVKLQKDVTTVVNDTAAAFSALAEAIRETNKAVQFLRNLPGGKRGLVDILGLNGLGPLGNQGLLQLLHLRNQGRGGVAPSNQPGQNTSDRAFGFSAGGAGTFPTTTRAAAKAAIEKSGLRAQFVRSQLALAKAQVTVTTADDKRVLQEQAKIIQSAIAQTTNLKKRTKLYQELADIDSQIRQIDQTNADKRTEAQQKILDARQKQLEKAKAVAQKQREQDAKELAALKDRQARLRDQVKAIQGRFKDAIDTARQGIGDLFTGTVLNPTDDARRHTLGLGRPITQDPAKLAADVRAQTAEFLRRQRDIAAIQKRAPKGLRAALGTELANVDIGTLDALRKSPGAFLKAFGQREQVAIRTARTVMQAQLVTLHADRVKLGDLKMEITLHNHNHLDGKELAANTTKHQARAQRRTAAQRTGRVAGLGPVVG